MRIDVNSFSWMQSHRLLYSQEWHRFRQRHYLDDFDQLDTAIVDTVVKKNIEKIIVSDLASMICSQL